LLIYDNYHINTNGPINSQNGGTGNWAYYYIDNISMKANSPTVTLNDVTMNCASSVTLQSSNPQNVASYQWFDDNNNPIAGAIGPTLTVSPLCSTTYKLIVTNYVGCPTTYYATVTVNNLILDEILIDPEISQHFISNVSGNTVFHYDIENPNPNTTYKWEIVNGSVISIDNVTGTSNVIAWVSPSTGDLLGEIKITQYTSSCTYKSQIYKVSKHEPTCITPDVFYKREWNIQNQNEIPINTIETWYLEGVTNISNNIVLSGFTIMMASNAKISIAPNCTLTINNCNISACSSMWDGIFANSNTENLIVTNSTIIDAVYGVQSRQGGNLTLTNNTLTNNLYDVQLINYKSQTYPIPPPTFTPASINIYGCDFGNPNNALSLKPPYLNKQTISDINIIRMENIQVGDATQDKNTFNKSMHGISIFNSKVKIVNSEFNNIQNQMYPSIDMEKGAIVINSINMSNMDNCGDITIGGSLIESNDFNDCYHSVTSNNSSIKIKYNMFNLGHQSVDIYNFKSGAEILNNTFKDIYFGIKVNNLLGVNRKIDVIDNYFGGQNANSYSSVSREAINLINCNSKTNSSIKSHIANNTINFYGQKSFLTSGIRIQNCTGIKINSNHIARTVSSPTILNTDWDKTIGIRVAKCAGAEIADNYIWGFGKSIATYGDLSKTQFMCNELLVYKYGFYWDLSTALSNQGIAGNKNNMNKWATLSSISGNEKLANILASTGNIINLNNIYWYYPATGFGPQWTPNTIAFSSYHIYATVNPNANSLCVGGSSGGGNGGSGTSTGGGSSTNSSSQVLTLLDNIDDPVQRDFLLEDILDGEQYVDLQNEYRAYDADFLYKMLAEDTTMMFLGGSRDTDYQDFFDSIQDANIGDFYEVYALIEEGDYIEATSLNNSIVPEQGIFINLKTVLGIYLNSWCLNRYDLTLSEYETLHNIALMTSHEGGVGVYTARIMIGFEPDDNGVAYRFVKPANKQVNPGNLSLYPNPASDEITIEFKNEKFENVYATVKIYSITGRLIYQTSFSTNHAFKVLRVKTLKNGVYLYHINLSNGMHDDGKLVIVK